jgi:hypothetical protein
MQITNLPECLYQIVETKFSIMQSTLLPKYMIYYFGNRGDIEVRKTYSSCIFERSLRFHQLLPCSNIQYSTIRLEATFNSILQSLPHSFLWLYLYLSLLLFKRIFSQSISVPLFLNLTNWQFHYEL